nr:hypothetical protein Iba_chr02cCG5790 [Ipomoea batatas]GME20864.1 hypothetical protein Iba_scaffold26298CG0030 [Ipomoea batatas]
MEEMEITTRALKKARATCGQLKRLVEQGLDTYYVIGRAESTAAGSGGRVVWDRDVPRLDVFKVVYEDVVELLDLGWSAVHDDAPAPRDDRESDAISRRILIFYLLVW